MRLLRRYTSRNDEKGTTDNDDGAMANEIYLAFKREYLIMFSCQER